MQNYLSFELMRIVIKNTDNVDRKVLLRLDEHLNEVFAVKSFLGSIETASHSTMILPNSNFRSYSSHHQ